MAQKKVKLALLLCDTPIPAVLAEHGDYTSIFTDLLRSSLPFAPDHVRGEVEFQLDPYDVRGKLEYPTEESLMDGEEGYKGVIYTGSAASAYEDVEWVNRLVDWTAWLAKEKPQVKIIGICFGQQIVARALGGSCVPNGKWEVGPSEVPMTDIAKQIFGLDELNIQQMHRDHVPTVPPSFHLLGSTPVAPVQGLVQFYSQPLPSSASPSHQQPIPTTTQANGQNGTTTTTKTVVPISTSNINHPTAISINPSNRPPPTYASTQDLFKDIHILTLQGHPEFTAGIVKKLIDAREKMGILKGEVVSVAREKEEKGWRNDGVNVIGKVVWGVVLA